MLQNVFNEVSKVLSTYFKILYVCTSINHYSMYTKQVSHALPTPTPQTSNNPYSDFITISYVYHFLKFILKSPIMPFLCLTHFAHMWDLFILFMCIISLLLHEINYYLIIIYYLIDGLVLLEVTVSRIRDRIKYTKVKMRYLLKGKGGGSNWIEMQSYQISVNLIRGLKAKTDK
jgi:hypothetical protein